MAKIALMVGISEYGSGLNSYPSALKDIEAMQQVLHSSKNSSFDEVKCLANPNPPMLREAIETLFSNRHKNDLIVLFFSGYVVQDDQGKIYFSTSVTCKTSRNELIRVSTVSTSFLQDLINNSECQRVVLILDYLSNNNSLEIETELGGEKQVILSFLNSSQNLSEQELNSNCSVYTSYLIEGMKTGVADLDNDGWIGVHELHQYATNKLRVAEPLLNPKFYCTEGASEILLTAVPTYEPQLKYRQAVEKWLDCGKITQTGRDILDKLAVSLELTIEECNLVENAALRPYQEYQDKLQRYKKEYEKTIENSGLVAEDSHNPKNLEPVGIKKEDIKLIKEQLVTAPQENELDVIQIEPENIIQETIITHDDLATLPIESTSIVATDEQLIQDSLQPENELEILPIPESTSESIPTIPDNLVISPPIEPTSTLPTHNEQLVQDSFAKINSTPLPPSIVVPDTSLTPNLIETTNTNNNKLIIPLGIAGILTTIAVVIAFFYRNPVTPPPTAAVRETTAEKPSSPSPIENSSPSPSPSAAPESQVCTIFVNGNLRSEPTYTKKNIIESLREPVPVTGKQTKGGWVEVKMSNDKLAWAYQDIISEKSRKEMDDCINKNKTKITLIEDIIPASNSSP